MIDLFSVLDRISNSNFKSVLKDEIAIQVHDDNKSLSTTIFSPVQREAL